MIVLDEHFQGLGVDEATRMGKVARVSEDQIAYHQLGDEVAYLVPLP